MRRVAPALAVLLLAACADIFSPERTDTYEFRCVPSAGSGCTDTLAFHWPRDQQPVRVFVATGSLLEPHLATAIARWNGALLYGELHLVAVEDSSTADIIIEHAFPPDGNFLREPLFAFATGCSGATDKPISLTFALPFHVYVWSNTGSEVPGLDLCYRITVTHELGHALGILNHSPNAGDVMYRTPVLDGLSDRDRQTIEKAYHTPANVTVTGRR